jgi:hypothetical protein
MLETLKLPQEMIGKPVQTTGTGRDVINRMSKAQEITAKYNNWDCI